MAETRQRAIVKQGFPIGDLTLIAGVTDFAVYVVVLAVCAAGVIAAFLLRSGDRSTDA